MSQPTFFTPSYTRLYQILTLAGEPDRVRYCEQSIDRTHKERYLGRPIRSVEDEVEFRVSSGFDLMPMSLGLQEELEDRTRRNVVQAHYGVGEQGVTERRWVDEMQGVITTRRDFESFDWPDPDALDYRSIERAAALLPPDMKVSVSLGKVFNTVWWLTGMETFSALLADDPDLVTRLSERVGEFQLRVVENLLQLGCVGALWHADDLAYSEGLLVSPSHLRRYVFPWYKEMNRRCREKDVLSVFHSDGKLYSVLEDIVDAGFHALNPIEPKAMDIAEVKRRVGSRIALTGNIDLGHTLTRGTPQEVEEEVRLRIRQCAPGGGYCVASSNSVTEYVPYENYLAMREATWKYGKYPITA